MAFRYFYDLFPDLAERETRTVTILPWTDVAIPTGKYALFEMFCDEPGCDCRRVFFAVHSCARNCLDAVIAWGWEDVEFYSRWMTHGNHETAEYLKGPSLNVGSPAAEHAPVVLELVREMLSTDTAFAQRIQRHYDLFRNRVEEDSLTDSETSEIPAVISEAVSSHPYDEPVSRLLSLGGPDITIDCAALGFNQEHVSELIRMATDMTLHHADSESNLVWAPLHAWRALGELGDEAAGEPLVGLLRLLDEEDDDWVSEDMPVTLGKLGSAAIPSLTVFLQDHTRGLWARTAASASLAEIAQRHPDTRDTCVRVLTNQLERFTENDEELNALLISALVDIDACESAQAMECAFSADAVDLSVLGDWEDVQIQLGLLDMRITPQPVWEWVRDEIPVVKPNPPQSIRKPHAKTKTKRKDQKKSRKKNRRK